VVDVKEPLQESAKFTLSLSLQLRLEQLEKMMGSSDSLANSNEVDSLRSGGGGWKRELGNEVEYDGVLAGAVKFTLQIELDHFYIAHGHVDIFVPQHLQPQLETKGQRKLRRLLQRLLNIDHETRSPLPQMSAH
jgi:hypothetical protein